MEGDNKLRLLAQSPNCPGAMDRQAWSLHDYQITSTLYSGYAAQVYTATCKYSGVEVVLKVYNDVDKAPDVAQHEMYREVAIQSGLQHPNIVHLFAAFQEGQTLVLVQEYAPAGDLLALMQSHGGRVEEAVVVKAVLRPLLGALLYLHRWGVVHRDVKPENVLFATDGTVKLADFGLAINVVEERPVSRVGTLDYMAPEVLRCPIKQSMAMAPGPHTAPRYGFATDVWAVGIVTYELLTGLPPYASECRYQAESRIVASAPPVFPHSMSPSARDFILRLLAPQPCDRPTVRQMLAHPWITDPDACVASHLAHAHAHSLHAMHYHHHQAQQQQRHAQSLHSLGGHGLPAAAVAAPSVTSSYVSAASAAAAGAYAQSYPHLSPVYAEYAVHAGVAAAAAAGGYTPYGQAHAQAATAMTAGDATCVVHAHHPQQQGQVTEAATAAVAASKAAAAVTEKGDPMLLSSSSTLPYSQAHHQHLGYHHLQHASQASLSYLAPHAALAAPPPAIVSSSPRATAAATAATAAVSCPSAITLMQHQQQPSASTSTSIAKPSPAAAAAAAAALLPPTPPTSTDGGLSGPGAASSPARTAAVQHQSNDQIQALQHQQLLDLSKLPLEQIQGMIQKLQQAMHLAVAQQQQQQQQAPHADGGSTLSPSLAALSSTGDGAAATATTSATTGDVQMEDAGAAVAAARGGAGSGSTPAVSGSCVHSSCHSPTHTPHSVRREAGAPTSGGGVAPHHAGTATPGSSSSPFALAANLASHILHHAAHAAASATADTASYTSTVTATANDYGSLCASRRTTVEAAGPAGRCGGGGGGAAGLTAEAVTAALLDLAQQQHQYAAAAAASLAAAADPNPTSRLGGGGVDHHHQQLPQQLPHHPTVRSHALPGLAAAPSPPPTQQFLHQQLLLHPVMVVPAPAAGRSGGGAMPMDRSSGGGGVHEGDGLVYVSIGSSRKVPESSNGGVAGLAGAGCGEDSLEAARSVAVWLKHLAAM